MVSSIQVSEELRDRLRKMKVHPREPYEDVIRRLSEKEGEQL